MWVNGYFCLDDSEGKQAKKSVEPGRPRAAVEQPDATPDKTGGVRPQLDATRVNATQKASDSRLEKASTYTQDGATSSPPAQSGKVYSVRA
jgi:hypothetical protein